MMPDRAAEAVRLGYRRLLVPVGVRARLGSRSAGAQVVEVATLAEALLALQAPPAVPRRSNGRNVSLRPVPTDPG